MEQSRIILPGESLELSPEETAVQEVLGINPAELDQYQLDEYQAVVAIVNQFSRFDPGTGEYQIISPSRIAAIPAITARHCAQQFPARGEMTVEQVLDDWLANTHDNMGDRHPDDLFNCAQWNFGSDADVTSIIFSITRAERERSEMVEQYKTMARTYLKRAMWDRPLGSEVTEEQVEELADQISHF